MARPIILNKIKNNGTTVTICMSHGFETIIDSEDYTRIKSRRWFPSNGGKYAVSVHKRKFTWLHRLINNTPSGKFTDHINGNGLDNRKLNLRSATKRQNCINWKRKNTTGYRGVYIYDSKGLKKLFSSIVANGKPLFIGYFKTKILAAIAYDKASLKYHGKFAVTNFPRGNYAP